MPLEGLTQLLRELVCLDTARGMNNAVAHLGKGLEFDDLRCQVLPAAIGKDLKEENSIAPSLRQFRLVRNLKRGASLQENERPLNGRDDRR